MRKTNNAFKKRTAALMALSMGVCSLYVPAMAEETGAAEKLGVVETAYGSAQGVDGTAYDSVTLFKGMPYAAPPVDDLRWKEPQDPESWDDVKVCDTWGDQVMQRSAAELNPVGGFWGDEFYFSDKYNPAISENGLNLNTALIFIVPVLHRRAVQRCKEAVVRGLLRLAGELLLLERCLLLLELHALSIIIFTGNRRNRLQNIWVAISDSFDQYSHEQSVLIIRGHPERFENSFHINICDIKRKQLLHCSAHALFPSAQPH